VAKKIPSELSNLKPKISKLQSLRVLVVEDSEDDVLLIIRELKKGGYDPVYERVETAAAMKKALQEKQWDIILCDYKLPKFNATSAIAVLKETNIDIPLIIVSGTIGEETAVECMRLGAQDYIMKDNLSRLCPAIARELEEAEVRNKQKQAEEALHQSEEKYRTILENIEDGYYEVDLNGNFTFFNASVCRILGYPQEEMMGMNNRQYIDAENAKKIFQAFNEVYRKGKPGRVVDYEIIRKDGTKRYIEVSVSLQKNSSGKPIGFRGISRDITERKQTEELVIESEARFRTLVENASDGIFVQIDYRFAYINPVMLHIFGAERPEQLLGQLVMDRFHPDFRELVRERLRLLNEEKKHVSLLEQIYLRLDGSQVRVEVSAMPIIYDGKNGAVVFVRDITERKQSFERMKKALRATVQAISLTVEMKDPYTSGHQQRVADLARAIATEMGLSTDRQDFIRTASTIHDIGKIAIPSEILSKPTKLTDLEFNFIKTHAHSGYDILKDIEFPWPVADVVFQHHERLNGSGYPQGLKGDDILLEARILSIADVVEAIAFHRPYRPAVGINLALEEISENKGILYDADAVDACLKLFREKGYTLVLKNR
jgi:PAS domain S-box-containing protein/putative nucleotidyltransferase with HDIG domain